MPKRTVIRASEIGAYVYCRRAWWLKRVGGFESEDINGRFTEGTAAHLRHGQSLRRAQLQRQIALILLGLGLLLLIFAFLVFR